MTSDRYATGPDRTDRSDGPGRGAGAQGSAKLHSVLTEWRNSLLDMGGRNRLLNFRHTRTSSLEITAPGLGAVLAGLGRGWRFAPVREAGGAVVPQDTAPVPERQTPSPGPEPGSEGLVTQKTTQASLDAALRVLRGRSAQTFNDYGLWVLWLGVGMLNWREPGAQETSAAPLLLVPVELRLGDGGRPRLHAAEHQDRFLNAALAVKATRLGLDWEPVAEADPADPQAVLAAARQLAAGQDGWSAEDRAVLGMFASYKEAMYQDLLQNADRITAHPLVRAVALGPEARGLGSEAGPPGDTLAFEPPPLDRIDDVQPPERTPLVLDADASQRQCVAAALEGRSFVMSGPPGTGKSQTITNMIAALMHAGRTVLFVSEKAAALDVVRNRLAAVGLADFALALHSGDTTKRAVATELHRVLTTEVRTTGAAGHELDRARALRAELSGYAAAMNQPREPFGRTVHDVLGRLVRLEQAGTARLTIRGEHAERVQGLTESLLQDLLTAAGVVARAWRPVAEGEAFAWRGLEGDAPLAALGEAADALHAVHTAAVRRPFADTAEPRTPAELHRLAAVLREGLPADGPAAGPATLPEDMTTAFAQLADLLGMPKPTTPETARALLALTDLSGAPNRPLTGWFDPGGLRRAHSAVRELRELRELLDEEVRARAGPAALFGEQVLAAAGLPELVQRFAEQHRGAFAHWSKQYKADRQAAAALTRDGRWHRSHAARLADALAWQQAAAAVAEAADSRSELLGRYTPRTQDDLAALAEALHTADRVAALSAEIEAAATKESETETGSGSERRDIQAALLADGTEPEPQLALLAANARTALAAWCRAAEQRADRWAASADGLLALFGPARRDRLAAALRGPFAQAQQTVEQLSADPLGPEEWRAHQDGMAVFARYGLADLVPLAAERGVEPARLPDAVEYALLRTWADRVLSSDARLRVTRSAELDIRVADFQEADRRLVAAAGGAVIEACNSRRPRALGGGAPAVIKRQAELKRPRMPVRDLLARTKEVVHAIKPCFMMSPLTVSQFLPPDFGFDVVIFDEASQVRPADAVNCVYRGRTLVVAGDGKQLPPTSFFDASVEDDTEEYDEDAPDSFESLLQACKAGALRELPLRWHYRSRHENLITFSNRSFYGNSMVTFPGATDAGDGVGVAFFRADGTYDRGGRRDNRVEARLVAQRVIHHFDTRPGRTLGVVALSQAQATAIEEEVQQARLSRPDLDERFTEDRLGGFFVKNLESVQGDERDVMILSIGYGPDEHGRLGLHFGPVNKDGGWRRLNVAVTRARYRMEVVASFHGADLADSPNPSVRHLKRYLEYAEQGPAALAADGIRPDAEPESPFEESVLRVLRDWGYDVQPQVGVAGYRIDLGLRHPAAPGAYALGIECDGAMYHSSRAARDRDRLREEVLTGLGWTLHRIWGTDWYRDRTAAEQRLRQAVERAVAEDPRRARTAPSPAPPPPQEQPAPTGPAIQRTPPHPDHHPHPAHPAEPRTPGQPPEALPRVPVPTAPDRPWSAPYEVCALYVPPTHEPHTPEARPALRKLLTRVIEMEGPIHEDLLIQRAREAWGVKRAGARIRDNIRQVVAALVRERRAVAKAGFLDLPSRPDLRARHPAAGVPRKCAHVPPPERHLALRELAAECPGMSRDELIRQTCDFFGWKRLGPDIRTTLAADLDALLAQGTLTQTPSGITAAR
ncbi:DUF3320 domain-containing protein [Streptomyces sp. B1866]|uniref:DUF3320 domain-containing protein n=1 Tax=Streptomyces sp. B1866 TaxID=3075431 RepID=UPI002890E952|nr:DUF3320 domain-containing protein [Streptomyces sp. B1866]MDT3395390.1 DUF3320 domain-containing protein [Streptomyces sp. B1866]